jgi:ferrous-iron efflux pump FieF
MPDQRSSILIKRAATASMVVAISLLLAKLLAWSISDSASVLSSLVDSLMDIAASAVNFFAVRYALMPPDEDHPFGHTKAEGLAALVQSAFILGSAVALFIYVLDRLFNPQPLGALTESIGVMLFSALLTAALVLYQRWVFRQTGSLAIKADSAHYYGDILSSLAVVVALIAAWLGHHWLDPLVALLIGCILLHSVYDIVKDALAVLMDKAMSEEDENKVRTIILGEEGVKGVHDLKTRQAGAVQFIQFHLALDGQLALVEAHAIGDQVEQQILLQFPRAEILIHQDPV